MRNLLLLILFTSFSVCSAQNKTDDPFIGHDKKEVIQQLGKPTIVQNNGAKGEILIYRTEIQSSVPQGHYGELSGGETLIQRRIKTFYVDKKGKIYAWNVK